MQVYSCVPARLSFGIHSLSHMCGWCMEHVKESEGESKQSGVCVRNNLLSG